MYMTLFLVRWRHLSVAVGGKMGNSRTKSEMGLFTKNAKKKVNDQPLNYNRMFFNSTGSIKMLILSRKKEFPKFL